MRPSIIQPMIDIWRLSLLRLARQRHQRHSGSNTRSKRRGLNRPLKVFALPQFTAAPHVQRRNVNGLGPFVSSLCALFKPEHDPPFTRPYSSGRKCALRNSLANSSLDQKLLKARKLEPLSEAKWVRQYIQHCAEFN